MAQSKAITGSPIKLSIFNPALFSASGATSRSATDFSPIKKMGNNTGKKERQLEGKGPGSTGFSSSLGTESSAALGPNRSAQK